MATQFELNDMPAAKHPRSTVEDASVSSDQDHMDNAQLAKLGKKSVLKRNFGGWTILGFSCAVLVTWEGTLMNFAPGLSNGGSAGLIYGYIFVWIGVLSSFACLCELVSIAPMAAGQYHWVAMLAPPRYSKYLSYITGWMNLAGWQGTSAAASFLTATMIQGLVIFTTPSYDAKTWHGSLMIWACVLVAIIINTVVSALLPILEGMILILHLIGFFAILITLLVFRDNDNGTEVFTEWRNSGNWPTQGLSWFVGLLGCVFSFTGVDCSFHMCEEVRNPSLIVPRSIMGSITINGLLGFGMVIAMLYSATDIDAAIETPTGYPFMEIFYQATGSKAGTAGMVSLIIVMTLSATVGVIASTSRMLWAFARDNALPFSPFLSRVESRTNMPVWSITTTCVISCIIGLINLGSSVVYNAIVSVAISGLYASYFMPAILLLYRRCDKNYQIRNIHGDGQILEWGPWHLKGMFGIINNAFACIFITIVWFFSLWPPSTPVDAKSMNYASLMTGGIGILATMYYFLRANKIYVGPKKEI
ncbi:GABA transport [Fusarium coicis]|nr:GABA transport [Fusarium coicis]